MNTIQRRTLMHHLSRIYGILALLLSGASIIIDLGRLEPLDHWYLYGFKCLFYLVGLSGMAGLLMTKKDGLVPKAIPGMMLFSTLGMTGVSLYLALKQAWFWDPGITFWVATAFVIIIAMKADQDLKMDVYYGQLIFLLMVHSILFLVFRLSLESQDHRLYTRGIMHVFYGLPVTIVISISLLYKDHLILRRSFLGLVLLTNGWGLVGHYVPASSLIQSMTYGVGLVAVMVYAYCGYKSARQWPNMALYGTMTFFSVIASTFLLMGDAGLTKSLAYLGQLFSEGNFLMVHSLLMGWIIMYALVHLHSSLAQEKL